MTAPPLTREQAQILVEHDGSREFIKEYDRIKERGFVLDFDQTAEYEALKALIAIAEAEE